MDAFAAASLALFGDPNLGAAALYTPPGGGPAVEVRVRLSRQAADPFGGGGDRQSARTAPAVAFCPAQAFADLGLPRPAKGALLEVGGTVSKAGGAASMAGGTMFKVADVEADPGAPNLRLVLAK